MLIKYSVYCSELSEFIQELKKLKNARLIVTEQKLWAHEIEFEDSSKVYLPLTQLSDEKSLKEQLFKREIVTDKNTDVSFVDDYYNIVDNRVVLRSMDDINEAQLRLNYICSSDNWTVNDIQLKNPIINAKVFRNTVKSATNKGTESVITVDGFDGDTMCVCDVTMSINYSMEIL